MSLEKITKYVEQIKVLEKELEQDKQIESTELNNQSDSYKAETYKITNSIGKLSSQIKMVEDEIACNIQDAYIDKAYAELASEMKFWGVNKPARKSTNSLQTLEERLKKLLIEKKHLEGDGRNKINESDAKIVSAIQKQHNNNRTAIQEKLQKIKENILEVYNEMVKHSVRDYASDAEPCQVTDVPCTIDIGNVQTETPQVLKKYGIVNSNYLKLPYSIDLTSLEQCYGNLYLDMIDVEEKVVEQTLLGIMMKYLESFPKKRLKFGIYSKSLESMRNFSDFFAGITKSEELSDETEKTEGLYVSHLPKIATTVYELEDLLSATHEQEEAVSNLRRASRSKDIFDLYEKGVDFEPFQCIVLHNVFEDCRDDTLQKLLNCLKIGVDAGARFLIVNTYLKNKDRSDQNQRIIDDIKSRCLKLTYSNNVFKSETVSNIQLIRFKEGDSPIEFMKRMQQHPEKATVTTYDKIGFMNPPVEEKALDLISIPVGVSGVETWNMRFACVASAPIANLVIGLPKSGKSTLIDSLILNGAMKYSPEDINFQLVDFKDGVSASAYISTCKIPHVTVVSQNNTSSDAQIIFNNILAKSTERAETFKRLSAQCGKTIQNIVEYNKWVIDHPNQKEWKKMPRILVIVDECQSLFAVSELAEKSEDILRKGRSQGIHLILSTQEPDSNMKKSLHFVEGRYCFKTSEDTVNDWMPGKGRVVQNDLPIYAALATNDIGAKNYSKVRIAFHEGEMEKRAAEIRKRWKKFPVDPLVIGDKSLLSFNTLSHCCLFEKGNTTIPLGEDYETHNLIDVCFDGQKQSAMVLAGKNQRNINNILISTTICARVNGIETYIVDASKDKVLTETHQKRLKSLGECVHLFSGSQYMNALKQVYDIFERRNPEEDYDPVFFIVNATPNIIPITNNLKMTAEQQKVSSDEPQRADYDTESAYKKACTRSMLNRNRISSNSTSTQLSARGTLLELVSQGYSRGIFVCVSTDGCTQFESQELKQLFASNIILVTNDAEEAVKSRTIESNKEGLVKYNSINENMMLLRYMGSTYNRFRVINY